MNIQTEHLEDHTARLTVEIDPERLEKAKRAAARQIARQVNIPGFRKGKAPYNIVVRNFGEATILNEAVEELSQEIYRETLEKSDDLKPYGPGAWEDFKLEPSPTFIYTVPLQPAVNLGDYRSVRAEYEQPEIDDDAVDEAIERLRQREALVEEITGPAELNHRVTLDIHSDFADEAPAETVAVDEAAAEAVAEDAVAEDAVAEDAAVTDAEATEDDGSKDEDNEAAADEDDEEDAPAPKKGDVFIHEHDANIVLDPDDEPIMAGFNDQIIGLSVGESAEFEMTIPDDDPDYEDIAGRKVHFHVTVKKVESVTLPELNDQFAANVTQEEDEPLTLLQLRMRMRENMQNQLTRRYTEAYATQVLDAMVKQATIAFPEAMIEEQIDSMMEDFEANLRQQGISLDVYTRVTGQDKDAIRAQYREPAMDAIRRGLVLTHVMEAEQVTVADTDIDARIDEMLTQFGSSAEGLRSIFDTPQMRDNIARDLLNGVGMERIAAIGRGIAPEPGAEVVDEDDDQDGATPEAADGPEAALPSEQAEAVVAEAAVEAVEAVDEAAVESVVAESAGDDAEEAPASQAAGDMNDEDETAGRP